MIIEREQTLGTGGEEQLLTVVQRDEILNPPKSISYSDFISYHRKINNLSGTTRKKDAVLYALKADYSAEFDENPDFEDEVYINDIKRRLQVVQKSGTLTKKTIRSYPGETFEKGDIVDCYGTKWLVTDIDKNAQFATTGIMEQCTHYLKWQDPDTLKIIGKWSIVSSRYSSGVDDGDVVSVGVSQYSIQLPFDDDTKKLKKDMRFLINISGGEPIAYKLTRFDSVTNIDPIDSKGFLYLKVDECQLEPDDNYELMVANYKEPAHTVTSEENGIEFSGKPEIRIGGAAKKFAAVSKESSTDFKWSLEGDGTESYVELAVTEPGCVKLKFIGGDEYKYKTFTLVLTTGAEVYHRIITVVPLVS